MYALVHKKMNGLLLKFIVANLKIQQDGHLRSYLSKMMSIFQMAHNLHSWLLADDRERR